MKSTLALSTMVAGLALLPAAGFAGGQVDQPQTSTQSTTQSTNTTTTQSPNAQTMASPDSTVATKVQDELAAEHLSGINAAADSSGVVSLSGTAATQSDVDKAISIAHNTGGVTAVNSSVSVSSSQ